MVYAFVYPLCLGAFPFFTVCAFGGKRCFGIVAGLGFLLVSSYEEGGANPELVAYRRR